VKFIPLQVSSPRSGFSLYLEPGQFDELRKHFRLGDVATVYMRPDSINVAGEKVEVHFDVSDRSSADSRMLTARGRFVRMQVEPIGTALSNKNIPDFGMTPAKLWFTNTPTPGAMNGGTAKLEFDLINLPPPIHRDRAAPGASPRRHLATPDGVPAPAPEPPKPQTVPILLSIAGKDMLFNLPIEQAFATALEWTQAGYKEAS